MRVKIRGVIYEDVPSAAKALGVDPSTVYDAMSRGRTDTCGQGRGKHGNQKLRIPPKPVKIGSKTFPSRAAVDRAFGLYPGTTNRLLRKGTAEQKLRFLQRLERQNEQKKHS